MGNQIQLFTNQLFGNVRAIEVNGVMWFVATDVATCLGYTNPQKAVRDHTDIRDRWFNDGVNDSFGPSPAINFTDSMGRQQIQYPVWINESGLYSLIFSSKMPNAIEFKYWVTSQVLPTMRQIGFDRAMEVLQQENAKLRSVNANLYNANSHLGEMSYNKTVSDMENKYLTMYIINNPKLTNDEKVAAFYYDPTVVNEDINMDEEIAKFKAQNNI